MQELHHTKSQFASEAQALWGFIVRQYTISRRYLAWEIVFLFYNVVNTLTIGLIAVGMGLTTQAGGQRQVLFLVVGALLWGFLSVVFMEIAMSVAWERWEGTIEATFMAPIHRLTHLGGVCLAATAYGLIRQSIVLVAVAAFFHLDLGHANFAGALMIMAASSLAFMGLGLIGATLPLLSPERGAQAANIIEGCLLLISGIYYPVTVLPGWLQPLSAISPATYTLEGVRAAILDGASTASLLPLVGKLLLLSMVLIPIGLWIFGVSERYAKRAGLLKRNG
jgi:ABC-2 type transport system permease protein